MNSKYLSVIFNTIILIQINYVMKFFRKKNNQANLNEQAFSSIQRTMEIEGTIIPGFIRNGSYFFTNVEIYSDGIIDVWEAVDLDFFKKKLSEKWVVPSVPNGREISIHHLGEIKIRKSNWTFNRRSYREYVLEKIEKMNPLLQNLYNFHGRDKLVENNINFFRLPISKGKPIKPKEHNSYFDRKEIGTNFNAFLKESDSSYYLCNISIFADESILIDRIPEPINTNLQGLNSMVQKLDLTTEVEVGDKIMIYGLGAFEVESYFTYVNIDSLMNELSDAVLELNGKPTSSKTCKKLYEKYLLHPTSKLKTQLKIAYEKVPDHLRSYVSGDMDLRDIPIRMIIYGKEEIKNWSHYILAEQNGIPLPQINIPTPIDEEE